ncbi:hypothetical protein [Azospirillum ramasamyi]|uniref:Uncharacterized protein n=1 Tax=Azospirillum ramasamyi TaxID=682998 RepID=A0A2U9S1X2_9PROT|nr:hypothetical protein [Azospirillum ramasamyi]AWU93282.1 hypothetical protein DM194_02810 [Azospirillum ramasamyi]
MIDRQLPAILRKVNRPGSATAGRLNVSQSALRWINKDHDRRNPPFTRSERRLQNKSLVVKAAGA